MSEFRIQQCLGRGGFGEVYKAVMSRGGGVEVDVAVKVLRPDLDPDSQGVKRLKDEGNLLGRLTHPTILRVYGFVEIEGRSALVTEYVPGDDLARLIKSDLPEGQTGSGIPPRAAFEIIAQVAAALDAAWSWPSVTDGKPFHLVHRDIKPDNIRIDPHGGVKLLDFGISLASSVRREAHTSVNTIMGSTQYLAPERLVQQEVGPESDVFALGCTLFEALTGEALFARKSMRQMYMLMVDEQRFEEFVGDRCQSNRERLGGDRGTALIRAMTAWRKQNRPTAAEVAARCDMIGDSTPGPTLTQWCRGRKWPPPPTFEGPLEGVSFRASEGLVDTSADTITVRPPAAAAVFRSPASLDETAGITAGPSVEDTTDARLRTEKLRATVLGELDHAPRPEEVAAASSAAKEGPLPWSEAEMVALWAEQEPTRRIARAEVAHVAPRRYPQLLRQRPGTLEVGLALLAPDGPTTGPTAEVLREPAPAEPPPEPTPLAEDPPPEAAPLEPNTAPIPPLPIVADVRDEPAPEQLGPPPEPVAPVAPALPEVTLEPPPAPRRVEEPTVRIRRNPPPAAREVTPVRERTVPLEPSTGPVSDQGGEPTLRLGAIRPERTVELPPEAQESTIPGIDVPDLSAPTPAGLDEVQRPLGPEPPEASDPDDENTDASALPPARDLRERSDPAPPPPEAPPLDLGSTTTSASSFEGSDAIEVAPEPVRRSRLDDAFAGNPRLLAIGASSLAGLVFGMGLLIVLLLIVLWIQ